MNELFKRVKLIVITFFPGIAESLTDLIDSTKFYKQIKKL